MSKSYKIKRYRRIYKKRKISPPALIAALAAGAAVLLLGFSLYGPVRDFLSGTLAQNRARPDAASSASSASSAATESLPQTVREPEPEETQSEAVSVILNNMRAVWVPQDVVLAGGTLDFVKACGLEGINTVLIDLKNEKGEILFQSGVQMVTQVKAQKTGAVDLQALTRQLAQAGYATAGRICAYRDPLAPRGDEMAAVKYMNSQWSWLDNEQNQGGQPWLNPYSPIAQSYITDLSLEAVSKGVGVVLLEAVQYPEGVGLHLATFGEWAASQTKEEALRLFVNDVSAKIEARKGVLLCGVEASDLYQAGLDKFGGASPAAFLGSALAVGVEPAQLGILYERDGVRIEAPVLQPYEAVRAQLAAALPAIPTVPIRIPYLQGYTDTEINFEYNKSYTAEEINEQIRAVTEAGIEGYIVRY